MNRILVVAAITILFLTSSGATRSASNITQFADEYVREFVNRFPEAASFSGVPGVPLDKLTDNSLTALRQWQKLEDRWHAQISNIDPNTLWNNPEWVTYGFLREAIDASRQLRVCRNELWPVNQMAGWQTYFAQLLQAQPIDTSQHRVAAMKRWKQFPRYLDTEISNLREGIRSGYTSPKITVELVSKQIDGLLELPFDKSPWAELSSRAKDQKFRQEWTELVNDEIIPSVRRYRDFLRNEYMQAAREKQAITGNPNGAECYRASFRAYTTLDRSPQETFRLGQEAVQRSQNEAIEIGKKLFADITDHKTLVQRLEADPKDRFKSRKELLQFSRDVVQRAQEGMPKWFGVVPKAAVVVEPHPEFLEAAVSSQYEPAPEDRSRPATYRIKLYKPEEQRKSVAEITAFHETWPGHHLQIAIGQQIPGAHTITRLVFNSGFVEGWARYSETLAEEAGLYNVENARVARRLWPARGMVMDPGLHLMNWTRDQAIEWAMAGGRTQSEAEHLVDRVSVLPAQLTAYDTGALEIRALRDKAERELGSKFNIREFHDQLLGKGSVTLPMMRQIIERWINTKTQRTQS